MSQSAPPAGRALVLASVMAATFMIAIEATIVATTMPQIAGRLGGLELYSWAFSAFLLAQTVTTVVFGKVADLFGRKPVLLFGIAIFLAGSLACGAAWSMPSLIAFRLVQGVGAGAIQPVCVTIVGDLYPARERGRVQGYIAAIWGASALAGPVVGGIVVEALGWPWIFWMNVPVAIAAAVGARQFMFERVVRQAPKLDATGASLFVLTITTLTLALSEAMRQPRIALLATLTCVVCGLLLIAQERRATEPVIALSLWARPPIGAINIATGLSGMTVVGPTVFLPMYVQMVLGQSPLIAGFALMAMLVSWPLGATLAAKSFGAFGIRPILILGAGLMPAGALPLTLLTPGASVWMAAAGSLTMGLGMGCFATAAVVLVQDSVGWSERGTATAANLFSRTLGNTLGATMFGAVVNFTLSGTGVVSSAQLQRLLEGGQLDIDTSAVRSALAQSLHSAFGLMLAFAAMTLVTALFVPRYSLRELHHDQLR